MSPSNGYVNGSGTPQGLPPAPSPPVFESRTESLLPLLSELEIPFDPRVIEWRVTNTAKDKKRGQVIPYADQRAYTDRLNILFTPAGWTRKYTVHTSPNFERGKDNKTVAKIVVTCEMTIFGIGSHSATGEEWADDENAATSAEAQAFKRACACFGLGRYLYHFTGVWVDLDENKRPKQKPALFGWATPEGWREGLRPNTSPTNDTHAGTSARAVQRSNTKSTEELAPLIRQIEQMQETLGRRMYRGLLRLAKAWSPDQIQDAALLQKTIERMQAAERGFRRLENALDRVSDARLAAILRTLKLRSIDAVDNLETLHKLVVELEAAASPKS